MQKQVYITNTGSAMMLVALNGQTLTFTNFAVGDGETEDYSDESKIKARTSLISPVTGLDDIPITSGAEQGEYIRIKGGFDTDDVSASFNWRELGIYACGQGNQTFLGDGTTTTFTITVSNTYTVYFVEKSFGGSSSIVPEEDYTFDPSNNTITFDSAPESGSSVKVYFPDVENKKLFAYGYDWEPKTVNPSTSDFSESYSIDEVLAIEDGASIVINTSGSYATLAELNAHINDKNNPHQVKASQVSITGNAGTSTVNAMKPSFSRSSSLVNLASGDRINTLFGKISKFVNYIKNTASSHVNDMNNPHGDSFQAIPGSVPASSGGTGSDGKDAAFADFWNSLIRNGATDTGNRNLMVGTYIGTAAKKRAINCNMPGLMFVIVCSEYGFFINDDNTKVGDMYYGMALYNYPCHDYYVNYNEQNPQWKDGCAIFVDSANGLFYVGTNTGTIPNTSNPTRKYHCHLNDDGVRYYFIAIKHDSSSYFLN